MDIVGVSINFFHAIIDIITSPVYTMSFIFVPFYLGLGLYLGYDIYLGKSLVTIVGLYLEFRV